MRFTYPFLLLLCLLPLATRAQGLCDASGLTTKMSGDGAWAVLNARGQVVIPYAQRPLILLTANLVKVGQASGPSRWTIFNSQGHQVLPQEYEVVEAAGCDHIQVQQGNETLLLNASGQTVYREAGQHHFTALPHFNRLLVTEVGSNQLTGAVRILELGSKRQVYTQSPAAEASPLYLDLTQEPGTQQVHFLPFIKVTTIVPDRNRVRVQRYDRVLDLRGKVLFDSIDAGIETSQQGLVYLYRRGHPVIITDTLLRPIPYLSHYETVVPTGPGRRWWAVSRAGKSGLLDHTGRVLVPVQHPGQFTYVGDNLFLLHEYRNRFSHYSLLTSDQHLVDLGDCYIGRAIDSTLAKQPLVLKNEKTNKSGLFDAKRGFVFPMRYDVLAQTPQGFIFFQPDSAGYLNPEGRLRLLAPSCQLLSEFSEGYAVCGKLVPNATRSQYPAAQIAYSAQGSVAVQYAYMNSAGKLISDYFDWVGPFYGGYAFVRKNLESYMIDTKGQKVTYPGGATLVSYFHKGLAVVQQGNRFGLADQTGRLVLPTEYKSIETERQYPGYSQLVGRQKTTNTLEPVTIPKLQKGSIRVVTAAGQSQLVAVPAGK
ncbi:MAG: WG repeat-containing protein [Janthinobacterium lividum]